jgi:hypothetical protein
LKGSDQIQWDGNAVILGIVADGMGVGKRLRHGVMQPVDDRRLLGGNVDQVW